MWGEKPFISLVITFCFLFSVFMSAAFANSTIMLSKSQKAAYIVLEEHSQKAVRMAISKHTRVPSSITLDVPVDTTEGYEKAARGFIKEHKSLFRIKDQAKELKHSRTETDQRGIQHVRFKQMYKGIQVFGTEMIVHIGTEENVVAVNGKFLPDISVATTPTVSAQDATDAAINDLGNANARVISEPELMVFDPGLITRKMREDHLVWKLTLYSENPLEVWIYFVDSRNGYIVYRYNNLKDTKNRETYSAENQSVLPGTLWITETWSSTDADTEVPPIAWTAHDYMGMSYDYYLDTFGRDSYDNAGAVISTTVHYGINLSNAFWNGYLERFGFGDGDGQNWDPWGNALDIVAHEFTHAVTQYTADLIYSYESGALNEAFSDIMSCMVDRDDWLLGEAISLTGGAVRSLEDPPLYGDPDHYFDFLVTTIDRGGVHSNSGIANKSAYLVSEGGIHNGFSVTGIGRSATEQIYYYALANILTNSSDFWDLYDAVILSAEILYGTASPEAQTIEDAFNAIGFGVDSDSDGLFDLIETDSGIYDNAYKKTDTGTPPDNPDVDVDGLWDGDEIIWYKTDPFISDTNGDGLLDGEEVHLFGSEPLDLDTDSDWLTDWDEIWVYHTDPLAGMVNSLFWTSPAYPGAVAAIYPEIGTDASGNIHIVWHDARDGSDEIFYTKLDNDGNELVADKKITSTSSTDLRILGGDNLAVDSSGNVHVVWYDNRSAKNAVYYMKLDNNGITMVDETLISPDGDSPSIAIDSSDNVFIGWRDLRDNSRKIYYTKFDNEGTVLIDDTRLSSSEASQGRPSLASDPSNNIHFAWDDYRDGNNEIYYAQLDNNGNTLVRDKRLTNNSAFSCCSSIATDSSGYVHVAWRDDRDGSEEVYYKKLANDRSGNTVVPDSRVSAPANSQRLDITHALDTQENIHLIWRGFGNNVTYIMLDNNGSPLMGELNNGVSSSNPDLAIGPFGFIHFVFSHGNWLDYKKVATDADLDNAFDGDEVSIGSDPLNIDTDNDGMNDGWELKYGLDPKSSSDATGDKDGDGLNNLQEIQNIADPTVSDTDNDGLSDFDEVHVYLTKAYSSDSDWDRTSDINDNCPISYNPEQTDSDGDGKGDACDTACESYTKRRDCNNDPACKWVDGSCQDSAPGTCPDSDGDGYGFPGGDSTCPNGTAEDCNDTDLAVNPGVAEICTDGIDNDCDGLIDTASDPDCMVCEDIIDSDLCRSYPHCKWKKGACLTR